MFKFSRQLLTKMQSDFPRHLRNQPGQPQGQAQNLAPTNRVNRLQEMPSLVAENILVQTIDKDYDKEPLPDYGPSYPSVPSLTTTIPGLSSHVVDFVNDLKESDPNIRKFFERIEGQTFDKCKTKIITAYAQLLKLVAETQSKSPPIL